MLPSIEKCNKNIIKMQKLSNYLKPHLSTNMPLINTKNKLIKIAGSIELKIILPRVLLSKSLMKNRSVSLY